MCLITEQSKPKIAKENITCYKVLLAIENDSNILYSSPIRHFYFFENNPNPDRYFEPSKPYWLFKDSEDLKPSYVDDKGVVHPNPTSYKLYSGYFHMYKNYASAYYMVVNHPKMQLTVFECVIPKGAKYYIGDSGDIVADKMIIFQDIQNMREYLFDRKENAMKFDTYCRELNFKIF